MEQQSYWLVRRGALVAIVMSVSLFAIAEPTAQPAGAPAALDDRLIVVATSPTVTSEVVATIAAAGGIVVAELSEIGVLVVEAPPGGGAQLRKNLLGRPAVLDVGSDWLISADPQSHWSHPLPTFSPALPPDFFYTSSPQQWPAKRIGAAGGGVPARPGDRAEGAWDVTFGRGAKIAIIDTGVNAWHPDLAGKVVFERALSRPTPLLGDVNCEVPDPANPPFDLPVDQLGHGTWTATLAAGALGGGLLVGVAPDAEVLSVKILRRTPRARQELEAAGIPPTAYYRCLFSLPGQGLGSWLLEALLLASAEGADVISMSLGGLFPRSHRQTPEPAVFRALQRAANHAASRGAVLVAAAMNGGLDLDAIGPRWVIPAELPNVIAVMATTNPECTETPTPAEPCVAGPETLASYSNRGARLHGLAAPGGAFPFGFCGFDGVPCFETGMVVGGCSAGVEGTIPPASETFPAAGPPSPGSSFGCAAFPYPQMLSLVPLPGFDQHMWYLRSIGTSAATPLVAGAAALVKAARPELTPAQIRAILQSTAEDLGKPGYDDLFNFGLVNAEAAVKRAVRD